MNDIYQEAIELFKTSLDSHESAMSDKGEVEKVFKEWYANENPLVDFLAFTKLFNESFEVYDPNDVNGKKVRNKAGRTAQHRVNAILGNAFSRMDKDERTVDKKFQINVAKDAPVFALVEAKKKAERHISLSDLIQRIADVEHGLAKDSMPKLLAKFQQRVEDLPEAQQTPIASFVFGRILSSHELLWDGAEAKIDIRAGQHYDIKKLIQDGKLEFQNDTVAVRVDASLQSKVA